MTTSVSSASSTSGTISSAGIGSGLDVDSIVTKLMAIEQQPLTALQTASTTLDSKISAFGSIASQLSSLNDAVTTLALPATWNSKTVSSSNSAAVGASVISGSSASATSVSVQVTQLAQAQSVASNPVATGNSFGAGTLTLQLGTWSGTPAGFAAGSAASVSVSVDQGDSVQTIASKINKAGAGVSATVLHDLSGDRLLLSSSATGAANGFRVQTSDTAGTTGASLSSLAFDDPASGNGMAANPISYGLNAQATINGIAVTSASNTLDSTVPGLTLTLSQVTTSPVAITTSNDTTSQTTAVNNFVKAYNAMNEMINSATAYDSTTQTAALLQGDSTTTGLQTALRSLASAISGGGSSSGNALQHLSDLGISVAKDGAGDLTVDTTKLATALKNPTAVSNFFTAAAPTDGSSDNATGFATRMSAFLQGAIGSSGMLAAKTASLQAQKTDNGKQQDAINSRLTTVEANLRKQYTDLDTQMASLTALNTYITQQIAAWNKSS